MLTNIEVSTEKKPRRRKLPYSKRPDKHLYNSDKPAVIIPAKIIELIVPLRQEKFEIHPAYNIKPFNDPNYHSHGGISFFYQRNNKTY